MNTEISLRRATLSKEDFEAFYKIKCDPNNVLWSGFATAPDHDNFKIWYEKQIIENIREIWFAVLEGTLVGFYYIMPYDKDCITGGYGVLSEYAGRGIGTRLMYERNQRCQQEGKVSVGWVAEENIASTKCMLKQGYQPQEDTEVRKIWINKAFKEKTFRKYVKIPDSK